MRRHALRARPDSLHRDRASGSSEIASTRYHDKGPGGTAGRILVLAGTDAIGRPYKSELMVFRENRSSFKAINAVYRSNSHILEGATSSPSQP